MTEAWAGISQELNHRILECVYLGDKKLYRRLVNDLSAQLRKRTKVILETPRSGRHQLFQPLLTLPNVEVLAQNLAIHWLSHERSDMVTGFLDHLGIEHDGHGFVDEFPDDLPAKKLKSAVDQMKKDFPEEEIWFYLRIFSSLTGTTWENLEKLVPPLPDEESDSQE
ncbi:MAG: hypothetical protein AAFY98_04420 [Verrucomicrobiota bacterium]